MNGPNSKQIPVREKQDALSLELCRPIAEHGRLVMRWRNDSVTRATSFHSKPKVWDSFWLEYRDKYFRHPDLPAVFVLHAGERVGFLRFEPCADPTDHHRRTVELSINIAPEHRGRSLGRRSLALVEPLLAATTAEAILAEVFVDNDASRRCFERAGYEFVDETDKIVKDIDKTFRIARYVRKLVPDFPQVRRVFVIAEAGSNWRVGTAEQDLARAKALIDVAAHAGADAVKFQTYRPETVYVPNAGSSEYLTEAGIDRDIHEIFADLAMPYEMLEHLAKHSQVKGIELMSTPFSLDDFQAVDPWVKVHKIASYEISHPHLIKAAAGSGKPLILSTGASTEEDIDWAARTFREAGGTDLVLMQCTARYPTALADLNLQVIPWLKKRFQVVPGLSDHSREPTYGPICAVALGARVIEKHLTLDNNLPGPDHAFALIPEELNSMVQAIRAAEKALGLGIKEIRDTEQELAQYARRGVQALRDITKGEELGEGDNIAVLRPGRQRLGVHPRRLPQIEGQPAARDIAMGHGIELGDWLDRKEGDGVD